MAQVKKPAVRDAILSAAHQLFRDQGYNGTTLTEIAAAAGISTANLYSYFKSKFNILYSIYDPWLRARLDRLEMELSEIPEPRMRLRHLVAVLWREIPAEENGFANNIIQAVSGASSEEEYDPSLLRMAEDFLGRMLREMLPRERRDAIDIRSLSHLMFMAFDGFAMNVHVNRAAACGDAEIEVLCNLILGPVAGAELAEPPQAAALLRRKAK